MRKIPCAIIRGGTSKGVYIQEKYLSKDERIRDQVILSIFGSPDPRQIDGLGGADPLTSKLAIIGPSSRSDADIDYTFAQVGIETDSVTYSLNCGNISSGVGPFAIDEGLVKVTEPMTVVRIFNTNSKKLIISEVPVRNGKAETEGKFEIDGVPGSGAEIALRFINPTGGVTGKLLPTGNVTDMISLPDGRQIEVSIVDAGNLYVFIQSQDLGLNGTEAPKEIDNQKVIIEILKQIKHQAIEIIPKKASDKKRLFPKLAFVNKPLDYRTEQGNKEIKKEDIDLTSRIVTSNRMHKAYAVTGAIATVTAALLKNSVVNKVVNKNKKFDNLIRIGHPAGIIEAKAEYEMMDGELMLKSVLIKRTARRIMDGVVYIPENRFHL